jgi:hypothetical protein
MEFKSEQWPIEKLKCELLKFLKKHRKYLETHQLSYHLFKRNGADELWEAIKWYGSFKKLRKYIKFNLSCRHERYTEKKLIKTLKELRRSGISITKPSLIKIGRSDLLTIIKQFGTLTEIKAKMGLRVFEKKRRTDAEIIAEYRKLWTDPDNPPTKGMLERSGHSSLARAIRSHFDGMQKFFQHLNISTNRKYPGDWTEERTVTEVKEFYRKYKKEIDSSSMARVLRNKNRLDLNNAIYKWGDLQKLNEKHNLNLPVYGIKWNREKIVRKLKAIHKQGHVITLANLRKLGYNDLAGNIYRFGKLNDLKKEIGAPTKRYGYWNDDTVKEALWPIVEKHDCIPSHDILKSLGRHDLVKAIADHGGIQKFAREMNVPIRTLHKADDGHYLQSSYECIFDNILFKYNIPHKVHVLFSEKHKYKCDFLIGDTYIEIAGYFRKGDTSYRKRLNKKRRLYRRLGKKCVVIEKEIFQQKIDKIEASILSVLKDIKHLKRKIKEPVNDVLLLPDRYWLREENIKKELAPFIKSLGRMPSPGELKKYGKANLATAVNKYYGSLYELGKKWGVEVAYIPHGYYTREKIAIEYDEACSTAGQFLSDEELRLFGHKFLANAIHKKKLLARLVNNSRLRFFKTAFQKQSAYAIRKAVEEYKKLCILEKRFLTLKEIEQKGHRRLLNFIKKQKVGIFRLRRLSKLNYVPKTLPIGYFNKPMAIAAYTKACKRLGYFMTEREAMEVMDPKLVGYISYNIGFGKIKKLTGLQLRTNKKMSFQFTVDGAVKRYKKICIREQYFVTMTALVEMREGKLARFILHKIKYPVIRIMTGLNLPLKSPAWLKKEELRIKERQEKKREDLIRAYEDVCLKQRRVLSTSELRDLGEIRIANALSGGEGIASIRRSCKRLRGLPQMKVGRRKNKKMTLQFTKEEAVNAYTAICIREQYFVTMIALIEMGEGKLARFILHEIKYPAIRLMTGLSLPFKSPALLQKEEHRIKERREKKRNDLIRAYEEACLKKKRMLSASELRDLGQIWVANALNKNRGIASFRVACKRLRGLPQVKVGYRKKG